MPNLADTFYKETKMKRIALVLSLALPLAFTTALPASAQKLDLEKVKCGDWLKAPKDSIAITLAWLDGYYQDEDADPVIDFDKLTRNAEKLAEACAKNPDRMLGDMAESLFGN